MRSTNADQYTIHPATMVAIKREIAETNHIAEWWNKEQKEMQRRMWIAEANNFINAENYGWEW